jgi:hypothetical protein
VAVAPEASPSNRILSLRSALALQRRREARPDGLSEFSFSIWLTVIWRARDVHPWDRDMPGERKAPRFIEQTLLDTEAAVERIFRAFPEIITLEVKVCEKEPASDRVIIAGTVLRSDLRQCSSFSIGMRLRMLGIKYHLAEQNFDPIAAGNENSNRSIACFRISNPVGNPLTLRDRRRSWRTNRELCGRTANVIQTRLATRDPRCAGVSLVS